MKYDPNLDFYAVLGIDPDADAATIQRVFRKKAKQLHPDVNPDQPETAKEQFQQINDAYRVLSNPKKRREYDELRWEHDFAQRSILYSNYQPTPPPQSPPAYSPPVPSQPSPAPVPAVRQKSPYRYILWFAAGVLLLNILFALIFLTGIVELPFLAAATTTPVVYQPIDAVAPTVTVAPDILPVSFEPYDTCDNPQASIRSPQSAQYARADMPLPVRVLVAVPGAYTYEVLLLAPNRELPIALKPQSVLGDVFTGEVILLPDLNVGTYGTGLYELVLMVYNQNQQEMTSCMVRLYYVDR